MAKLKEFSASYGTTIERNGVYHKLSASVTIEMEEGDKSDQVKDMAWNTVYTEIEKQLRDL